MFTYSMSTVCVLSMLVHLSLGHVTLLERNFNFLNFFLNQMYGIGLTYIGFCLNFLVIILLLFRNIGLHEI